MEKSKNNCGGVGSASYSAGRRGVGVVLVVVQLGYHRLF